MPNDYYSGGEFSRVHVLLAPNASGKSVYLKQVCLGCSQEHRRGEELQVGICVFLAHIGSYVPCTSARIGVMNGIFSRVHTLDSVLDGMSTFAVDLKQVHLSHLMKNCHH